MAAAASNHQLVVDAWNAMAGTAGLPRIKVMDTERSRRLSSRLVEHGVDGLLEAIRMAGESTFCRGVSDTGWKANFDFLLSPKGARSLREGKYANGYRRPLSQFEIVRGELQSDSLLAVRFDDESTTTTVEGYLQ